MVKQRRKDELQLYIECCCLPRLRSAGPILLVGSCSLEGPANIRKHSSISEESISAIRTVREAGRGSNVEHEWIRARELVQFSTAHVESSNVR